MLRIRWDLVVVSILIPLANVQGDDQQGAVTGIVILEQNPPAPLIVKMKPDMQMFTGKKTLSIQRWLVGNNHGLVNCVGDSTSKRRDSTSCAEAIGKCCF
jgi:hypothetical protein